MVRNANWFEQAENRVLKANIQGKLQNESSPERSPWQCVIELISRTEKCIRMNVCYNAGRRRTS